MSRPRTLALVGIAVIAGIALIENATRSDLVVPATVTAIATQTGDEGPDVYILTAALPDGTPATVDLRSVKPDLQIGAQICMRVMTRSWAATKYVIDTDSAC